MANKETEKTKLINQLEKEIHDLQLKIDWKKTTIELLKNGFTKKNIQK